MCLCVLCGVCDLFVCVWCLPVFFVRVVCLFDVVVCVRVFVCVDLAVY